MNPLHAIGSRSYRRTPRYILLLIPLVIIAFSAGTSAVAQDKTSAVDEIFSWTSPSTPGCAVGVSQDGEQVVNRAYGLANLERGVPISPSTIFDIGSVQKQFVAAGVLLLAEEGRIALADDVRKYFPELPDYGHTITIDHLLTHTSGLRDWVGLARMSSEDEEALTMILRQRGLNFAPGEEWSYSNSGYVLLKELIVRTTGMSFSEFARKRLFDPLGMESTSYADDILAAGDNGALAYEKEDDGWKEDVMLGEERGGGAVLSTASDLLIWNDALTSARLGSFVTKKLQEPVRLNNGRVLGYARGLFLDHARGRDVVWHTGSAGAYKTMLARFPEYGLSVAILCNAGEMAERSRGAQRLVDLFAPVAKGSDGDDTDAPANADAPAAKTSDTAADAPAKSAERTDEIDLTHRTGLFISESTGEPLQLVVHEGRLRIPGGPPLVAESESQFRNPEGALSFMSGDEFEIQFVSPDEFDLTSMEGESTRYLRAQPPAPAASELQEFAGRYESEQLKAVLEIAQENDGLTARLNDSRAFELTPVHRDTYQLGRMTVRFSRNASGEVVAIDYSNPVVRSVTFSRLSDDSGDR